MKETPTFYTISNSIENGCFLVIAGSFFNENCLKGGGCGRAVHYLEISESKKERKVLVLVEIGTSSVLSKFMEECNTIKTKFDNKRI